VHEIIQFLASLSGVPVRFHVFYELNRHNVDSCALKYGHTKCSRSVIDDYFKDYIQVGKSHDSKISKYRKYQKKS